MAGDSENRGPGESRPVLWFLTAHWLSVLGSALVTIAGCSWLFLIVLHAGGARAASNPYLGILVFLAIPVVFLAGLILIPIGAWLSRRRIQAALAGAEGRRVILRRLAWFFGIMTIVNLAIASQLTYRGVTWMEGDQFCGQSCHIMKPQFVANKATLHRNVGCVSCHVVPGAEGFVTAKMNGTRQLAEITFNTFPRPVPPALQTNRLPPSGQTCEECHARDASIGSQLVVKSKFKDDEMNTPASTVLMMNVGGGDAGGIHGAHMGRGVQIRYRATDNTRRAIPWAEYRNTSTGVTRTYTVAGAKPATGPEFVMGCADCHNRAGHDFLERDQAVDQAMAAGRIPVGLPFAHKTAIEILNAHYASDDEAGRKIPAAFTAFYRRKYPDVAAKRAADIRSAGETLASIYAGNVFPDLGVEWGTYRNNLGHANNAGCFRCHDESHATAQKKTITQDCSACHNMIAVDETSPAVLKTLGLDQTLSQRLRQ